MRDLASIQRQFLDEILNGDKNNDVYNPYSDLVFSNHSNALNDVYPVCKMIVGEQYFSFLSDLYLRKRQTNNPDINFYGHDFADFLKELVSEREELGGLGYLFEVAEFEWAVYFAQRKAMEYISPKDVISKITSVESENVVFKLNPSLSFLEFNYPVINIWKAHQLEDIGEIRINNSKNFAVVWKQAKDVCYQNISKNEFDFLNLLKQKKSFIELSDLIASSEKELENIIAASINNGWVIDIKNIV